MKSQTPLLRVGDVVRRQIVSYPKDKDTIKFCAYANKKSEDDKEKDTRPIIAFDNPEWLSNYVGRYCDIRILEAYDRYYIGEFIKDSISSGWLNSKLVNNEESYMISENNTIPDNVILVGEELAININNSRITYGIMVRENDKLKFIPQSLSSIFKLAHHEEALKDVEAVIHNIAQTYKL